MPEDGEIEAGYERRFPFPPRPEITTPRAYRNNLRVRRPRPTAQLQPQQDPARSAHLAAADARSPAAGADFAPPAHVAGWG